MISYDDWLLPDYCSVKDEDMLYNYMDKIKEEALKKLTNLEVAALFDDFKEFAIRLREEMEQNLID